MSDLAADLASPLPVFRSAEAKFWSCDGQCQSRVVGRLPQIVRFSPEQNNLPSLSAL